MRMGWLVLGGLALVPVVAQAQQSPVVREMVFDPATPPSSKMSGHAGSALASGSSAQAAVLADQALKNDGRNAWAHYRRAAALSDLHRTDEAVAEYKVAEQSFGSGDEHGLALAVYGRANTLAQAGRCDKAQPVFEQYAKLVEMKDPKGAEQARAYASSCHTSTEEPAATATNATH